jgi:uncharacterized protein (DUF488 family)
MGEILRWAPYVRLCRMVEMNNFRSIARSVLTVGHSDHPLDHFLNLLRTSCVEVIVDTRSYPYSNFAPQYDQQPLKEALSKSNLQYLYLGRELGGRPDGDHFYDAEGHVLYNRVADSDLFQQGLTRLETGIRKFRVALLCAEENPASCHRRLLVSRVLLARGIAVDHIRGDGRLQSEADLVREIGEHDDQMPLFQTTEDPEWKSIPSVLRKKRQSNSSAS